jgi:hypothetical protein
LPIPGVGSEREETCSEQLRQDSLTRREIEAPEASGLADRDSEVGCIFEFFTNELNELSERESLHLVSWASACVYEARMNRRPTPRVR